MSYFSKVHWEHVSNLHSSPASILTPECMCSKQCEWLTLSHTVCGPVWVVGAVEDECNTEQGSGCLLVVRPCTAPHCSFAVSHLETNTSARASLPQTPLIHVENFLPALNITQTSKSTCMDWINLGKSKEKQKRQEVIICLKRSCNAYFQVHTFIWGP